MRAKSDVAKLQSLCWELQPESRRRVSGVCRAWDVTIFRTRTAGITIVAARVLEDPLVIRL